MKSVMKFFEILSAAGRVASATENKRMPSQQDLDVLGIPRDQMRAVNF